MDPRRLHVVFRLFFYFIFAGILGTPACQPPSKPPPQNKAPDGTEKRPPARPRAGTPRKTTAGPAPDGPVVRPCDYDPQADPQNAGGFDLRAAKSPTAAADRKKKPFDLQALYGLVSVGQPVWSPDGSRMLFSVTRHDLKEAKSRTDLYRLQREGKGLRRMTHHQGVDTAPSFSPDGKWFVFLSTRDKKARVYKMHLDGGEPAPLFDFPTGVTAPRLTPDGRKVLFVSRIYPEAGADPKKNKALRDAYKNSPHRAHVSDHLLFRHWTHYRDGRYNHILSYDLKSESFTALTAGEYDAPAFSLGGPHYAIAPDGGEICFAANREAPDARAWTTNKDLFVVSIPPTAGDHGAPAQPRKPKNLTARNKAFDGHPRYSPDGRHIAFLRQKTPGYESDRLELALYDRKKGTIRILTEGFDNWVLDFRWAADSQSIVFKAAEKARFPLYRLQLASGKITRLPLPSVRAFALSKRGDLAFTFSRVHLPRELYLLASTAKKQPLKPRVTRLTHFNRSVSERYDLRPAKELWLAGADGKKVHVFVVTPHRFDPQKRYPLIVNIHGGPQYQWSDALRGDWQIYPGAGYVVAFLNPHGSIGYGQRYTRAISGNWGGKVYKDIMQVTDQLAKLPYVDENRMGAMGWSYGGYMINWILGHTDRFRALASMMGVYDLASFYGSTEELWFPEFDIPGTPWQNPQSYKKWSPSSYAKNFKTPTLIISGELDYRIPYTQSLQLFSALRRQNVAARIIVLPHDGHWPNWVKSMPIYYVSHLEWFHRYLGGKPAPYSLDTILRDKAF
jgi:dipeptidyl aminopeptidase/acylaminoacyl peptidase